MSDMKTIILAIFIGIFGCICLYFLYCSFKGNYLLSKLSDCLIKGDTASFDNLIGDPNVSKYIKPFNLDFIMFNRYVFDDNISKAKKMLTEFENVNLNKKQKLAIYQRAYYYFLSKQDNDTAKVCYDKLNEIGDFPERKRLDITYDTYVVKGYKYLEETLSLMENTNKNGKYEYMALVADMYYNKGNLEKYKEYKDILEKVINE